MDTSSEPRTGDPRARAAQTKRDRTRSALLAAADAAFGSRGWARTRVEDIAAAAGVSPATAYNHFPSKHALIGHVYAPLVRPLVVQAERDIAMRRPVVLSLTDQVRALIRIMWRHQGLSAALAAAVQEYLVRVGRPPDPGDDLDPRVLAPLPRTLQTLIDHGQRTGELRAYPPGLDVSASVVNLLLIRAVNRPDDPVDDTAELFLTMLFGVLRPELLVDAGPDGRPFRRH
jgi:AcrR family transcriptional regulator